MTADLYLTLVLIIGICVVFALAYVAYWLRDLAKKEWKLQIDNNFTTPLTATQIKEIFGDRKVNLRDLRTGRVEVL